MKLFSELLSDGRTITDRDRYDDAERTSNTVMEQFTEYIFELWPDGRNDVALDDISLSLTTKSDLLEMSM